MRYMSWNIMPYTRNYSIEIERIISIHCEDCVKIHNMNLKLIYTGKQCYLSLNALKFYYRYLHETFPSFFYCFGIATEGAHHSHDTRQRDQIRTHRSRTDYCENRLRVYLPKLINSTPLYLLQKITTHSIQGFSSGIKNHFLCKYDDSYSLTNCYICRHNGQW